MIGASIEPHRCQVILIIPGCATLGGGRVSFPVGCPDFKPGEVC
jgi:hypothetical protein